MGSRTPIPSGAVMTDQRSRPGACHQISWPSAARRASIVVHEGMNTVRVPRTSVTAADATIWPL